MAASCEMSQPSTTSIFCDVLFHHRTQVSGSSDHGLQLRKRLMKNRIFFPKLMFSGILLEDMKLLSIIPGNLWMPSLAVTNEILIFYTGKPNHRHSFILEHTTELCQIEYWMFCKISVKSIYLYIQQQQVVSDCSASKQCSGIQKNYPGTPHKKSSMEKLNLF